MDIIDFQLHEPGPVLGWEGADRETRDGVLTELVCASMEAVGVTGAVLNPTDDADWCLAIAHQYPDRFSLCPGITAGAVMPSIKLDALAPGVSEDLAEQWNDDVVRSFRFMPGFFPGQVEMMVDGAYDRALQACERLQAPVAIALSGTVHVLGPLARKFPELQFILDHAGFPQPPFAQADQPPWQALDDVLSLAQYPNVSLQLCGLQSLSAEGFPHRDIWPQLEQLLGRFEADRLVWASDIYRFVGRMGWSFRLPAEARDYPGRHTYAESVAFVRDLEQVWGTDREKLLSGNARRLLRWAPTSESTDTAIGTGNTNVAI